MDMKIDQDEIKTIIHQLEKTVACQDKIIQELRANELKYRSIFEYANEAIVLAQNGYFLFPNAAALSLFVCTEEELTAKPLALFIHPDHRLMVTSRHINRIKGETLPPIYPFKILALNGIVKWVELSPTTQHIEI